VALHNQYGRSFALIDIKRWLRLNRVHHKTDKVDVLARGTAAHAMIPLLDYAKSLDMRLSLRTDCSEPPEGLHILAEAGLLDVHLCSPCLDGEHVALWLAACKESDLPVRLQILAPFPADFNENGVADSIAEQGVRVVNAALFDPFCSKAPCTSRQESERTVAILNRLAATVAARGIESNLLGLPFCYVDDENAMHAANSVQFNLDHQHYVKGAYELATRLFQRRSSMASKAILILLAQHTLHRNRIDSVVLPWLMGHPWYYARAVALQKLVHHLRPFRRTPPEIDGTMESYQVDVIKARWDEQRSLGPVCSACSLKRICDHDTPEFGNVLPGLEVKSIQGDLITSPQHFCLKQPKHYDAVDADRLIGESELDDLAKEANAITNNEVPNVTITPYEYTVEDAPYDQMEGGLRWHSITNTEKLSSALARLTPPFTVSVGFGGGIAQYVGFSFGRHCKLLCPMEGHKHEVTLHAAADGRFTLLRDGVALRPSVFEQMHYVPARLGDNLELRVACWNIDAFVVTQFVRIWQGIEDGAEAAKDIKYSVLVVTTRYARRLQAVLRSIAHQTGIALSHIEVVVAYVPGLDGTEDLLDSIQMAYPELSVVRCPYAREHASSKGFMINEAANMVRGEWTMLLDSDTLIAPNMFAEIEKRSGGDAMFYAPDGRKMLCRETTHKILLGEISPWEQWGDLLGDAGEYRYREAKSVPIGYCQVVKTSCLREIPYTELDHFEGADMWFGMQVMAKYGKEERLSGLPVLHLDHGGSQWYGTTKHF
jgi:hypothetical protein